MTKKLCIAIACAALGLWAQSAGVTNVTVSFSATPTFTTTAAVTNFDLTLTGNVTSSTFSSAAVGIGSVNICQDGTGSRTLVWPVNFVGFPVVTSTASVCTRVGWKYDGTNVTAVYGAGPAGGTGSPGAAGPGYTATSTTSLVTAGSGSKSFTTQSGLAYTAGARIRATSAGTSEYMEGVVTSYSTTTLVATMDRNSGTGTHADWNLNLAGDVGASGTGSGTVTSITLAGTANQITVTGTCTVTSTGTCTFSIPSAFQIPGTINKITLTQPATGATITVIDGKTATFNKSITFDGTDSTTMTFPATSKTIAANDLSNVAMTGDVVNSGLAMTIQPLAVNSGKMAVANTRRTICIPFGAKNASSALADTDLADSDLYFVPAAATLVEITVRGDAGTPNVILGRDRAGSVVNLTSSALATAASGALACSNAGGTTGLDGATTCGATLQNTSLSAGDWIKPVSGTAGGTAKQMSACLTMTVN